MKQTNEAIQQIERNNPPTGDRADKLNQAKIEALRAIRMRAVWSPINFAWMIVLGDSHIDIEGQWFFITRTDLRLALAGQGLRVDLKSNFISMV